MLISIQTRVFCTAGHFINNIFHIMREIKGKVDVLKIIVGYNKLYVRLIRLRRILCSQNYI